MLHNFFTGSIIEDHTFSEPDPFLFIDNNQGFDPADIIDQAPIRGPGCYEP